MHCFGEVLLRIQERAPKPRSVLEDALDLLPSLCKNLGDVGCGFDDGCDIGSPPGETATERIDRSLEIFRWYSAQDCLDRGEQLLRADRDRSLLLRDDVFVLEVGRLV